MSIHDEMLKMERRRQRAKFKSSVQDFLNFTKDKQDKDILRNQIDEYEEYLRKEKDKEVQSIIDNLKEELD